MMRQRLVAFGLVMAVLAASSAALLVAGFSLQDGSPPPSESPPDTAVAPNEPTPQPTVDPEAKDRSPLVIAVDGRIEAGEYDYVYEHEATGLLLAWRIEPSRGPQKQSLIYIGLHTPKAGRVQLVLAPSGSYLAGGDVLIGYVGDDGPVVRDEYGDGPTTNIRDADQPNGEANILRSDGAGGTPTAGTTVEFVRAVETDDTIYDRPIQPGPIRIRLGHGSFKHTTGLGGDEWTTLDVDFFEGVVEPVPQSP